MWFIVERLLADLFEHKTLDWMANNLDKYPGVSRDGTIDDRLNYDRQNYPFL